VGHEHEVAGLVPAVMKCVVVDVAEDRSCPDAIGRVLGVDELAESIHHRPRVLLASLQHSQPHITRDRTVLCRVAKENVLKAQPIKFFD